MAQHAVMARGVSIALACRAFELIQGVQNTDPASPLFTWNFDQHLVTIFRYINGCQNRLTWCKFNIGHSQSPLQYSLLQNYCRDLSSAMTTRFAKYGYAGGHSLIQYVIPKVLWPRICQWKINRMGQ